MRLVILLALLAGCASRSGPNVTICVLRVESEAFICSGPEMGSVPKKIPWREADKMIAVSATDFQKIVTGCKP